jgi:trk system potassium uptake protein TrkA
VKQLQDLLDINVVVGKGSDLVTLQEAGLPGSDIFLALTDNDEANVLACTFAKQAGVKLTVARLNELRHLSHQTVVPLKTLGVDEYVEAEQALIDKVVRLVKYSGTAEMKIFLDQQYQVSCFTFTKDTPYYDKVVGSIAIPPEVVPLGYMKVGGLQPYDPKVTIDEFTYLYLAYPSTSLERLYGVLYPEKKRVSRALLFGSGYKSVSTPIHLAAALQKQGVSNVTIVTDDQEAADFLSQKASVPVLFADPSKPAFAKTDNLANFDAFIALSNNFEKNLFACAVAMRKNVPFTYALVRYPEHVSFMSMIPLTSFLNPALITANRIMSYITPSNVLSRSVLVFEQAEIVDFVIREKSEWVGKPASALRFESSKILAGLREGALMLPSQDWTLQAGDRALLFVTEAEKSLIKKSI